MAARRRAAEFAISFGATLSQNQQPIALADIAKSALRGRTAAAISPIALVKRIDALFEIEREINA
ncbi:hypothetical protein ACVJGD_008076 [Bradyrhizobium sp. USDA 10063]